MAQTLSVVAETEAALLRPRSQTLTLVGPDQILGGKLDQAPDERRDKGYQTC